MFYQRMQKRYCIFSTLSYIRIMDYYESAEDITISQDRALQELARHGITSNEDIVEFFADMGQLEDYNAQAVLVWLGY